MNKSYRITLVSRLFKTDILTYLYNDILPLPGDLIEIIEEDIYFCIQSRAFKSDCKIDDSIIPVTFFGEIEGHNQNTEKSKFDAIITKIEFKMGKANNNKLFLKSTN